MTLTDWLVILAALFFIALPPTHAYWLYILIAAVFVIVLIKVVESRRV